MNGNGGRCRSGRAKIEKGREYFQLKRIFIESTKCHKIYRRHTNIVDARKKLINVGIRRIYIYTRTKNYYVLVRKPTERNSKSRQTKIDSKIRVRTIRGAM